MTYQAQDLLAAAGAKLHTPLAPTRVHISARVTVFFAAAGFGKTYAMADACERLRGEGGSAAWLSCAALALPAGDVLDGVHQFFDLFDEAETVFIDDLEVLTPEQRKALLKAFVLTAPHRRIVLAARSLEDMGLARLVADGAVQLVQADALRWRRRQLSELWQNRLTAKQINFIDGIAQGWPAVSQLLARCIVRGGELPGETTLLNASLAGDYIRNEVLAAFRPGDLPILAMTSLVDGFDDALINQFAGRSALSCDELMRRLPGLCSYQSDSSRVIYNRALSLHLQHVFASLPDSARRQALVRAADWASAQGDVVLAGKLAARAGDRKRIVEYVTKAGGLKIHVTKGYDDMRAVVEAAGEAVVAEEPRLKLLKCLVLLKDGRVKEAVRLYQEAAAALPGDADTERGAAFARLSLMLYGCQLAIMTNEEIELAARRLDEDPAYREIVPTTLAVMHSQQADFAAAAVAISVARAHGRQAGTTYNVMFLDVHSAGIALACGNLEGARAHLSKARLRWRAEFPSDAGAETVMLSLGAQLAFERGNIHQARQHIAKVGHRLQHSEAWLDIYFAGYEPMFRMLAQEQGLPTALAAIDRSLSQLQDAGLDRIATGLRNLSACLIGEQILRGRGNANRFVDGDISGGVLESWQEKELRLLASAYRDLVNRKPGEARAALDSLIDYANAHGLLRSKLRALLLRQVAKDMQGDTQSATADFHDALEIGERTGMRQAFLEFGAETVRARLSAGAPPRFSAFAKSLSGLLAASLSNRSDDALTRRETEVLGLLATGDSDKGIARQLHVTEFAVRFHLKNIYRKLGVHDRSAAIGLHRSH